MKSEAWSYVSLALITVIAGVGLALVHPALAVAALLIPILLYRSIVSARMLLVVAFVPILVSDRIIGELVGISGATTLQKAAVLACMLGVVAFAGSSRVPKPVFVIWLLYALFAVVSVLRLGGGELLDESAIFNAAVGFCFPLVFFLIPPSKIDGEFMLKIMMWMPLMAVLIGVLLQVLGISDLFRQEYTGARRLTGGLFAAYMGAYGMFGAFAAIMLWMRRIRFSLLFICFNVLVVVATGTRGPLIVIGLVIVAVVLAGGSSGGRVSFTFRALITMVGVAAAVIAAPLLLERVAGAGSSQGALSGREIAWEFFWTFVEDKPWFGNGLGFSSVAGATSSSEIVRMYFVAPHNTYLQLSIDVGILGAVLLVAAYVWLGVVCVRNFRGTEKAVVVAFLLGIAFYAFFDNLLGAVQPTVLFGLTLAALHRMRTNAVAEDATPVVPASPATVLRRAPARVSGARPASW